MCRFSTRRADGHWRQVPAVWRCVLRDALELLWRRHIRHFGEVAFVAGFGNGRRGGRTVESNQVVEFVFELLEPLFAIILDF